MLTESDLSAIEAMLVRLLDERLPKRKPRELKAVVPSDAFEAFWEAWPTHERKTGKAQCKDKWVSRGCDQIAEQVMKGLENSKRSTGWNKNDGEFIPAPLVWLNQSRWTAPSKTEVDKKVSDERWHESRAGIEAKGIELGLGKWDEAAAQLGKGDQWPSYRAKVLRAAGQESPLLELVSQAAKRVA